LIFYENEGMQKWCNEHFGQIGDHTDFSVSKYGIQGTIVAFPTIATNGANLPLARSLLRLSGNL
jgi:hypothetical protein